MVEAALVMPVLLFAFLAMAEIGFLFGSVHSWQRGVDALADAAAIRISQDSGWRPGWEAMADDERLRVGCGEADVTFPDGNANPGNRVQIRWQCVYDLKLVNGADLPPATFTGVAVIPQPAPTPLPSTVP